MHMSTESNSDHETVRETDLRVKIDSVVKTPGPLVAHMFKSLL